MTQWKKSPRSIQKVYFSDLETGNMSCRGKIHGLVKDEEKVQEKTQARIRHFFRRSWSSCPNLQLGGQCGEAMRKHPRQKEEVLLILPSEVILFFFFFFANSPFPRKGALPAGVLKTLSFHHHAWKLLSLADTSPSCPVCQHN